MTSPLPDYDGAEDILRAWQSGLAPDPAMTVSEWADEHAYLPQEGAAEPGKYRVARAPFLRTIMDALSPGHWATKIVWSKSAQVGATQAGIVWMGYVMDVSPGAMLAVQANEAAAKKLSRQRLDSAIRVTPRLREIIAPQKGRESANTMFEKSFPGGHLFIQGGNSAAGLRSMPIRYVHLDEVDSYEDDLDGEGDPVSLAEARTITYGRRKKIFISSTPTIRGASRVEREFELTDQNRYHVPCPHCGALQWLKFERLKWEWGKPRTAAYQCEHCDELIEERNKTWMLDPANGADWMPTAAPEVIEKARESNVIGFHISGLYSPLGWLSWPDIASQWEDAQGHAGELKAFKNTILGESWEERGEAPDWQRLYDRREAWDLGQVPDGVLFLTMGVDVQRGSGGHGWLDCHIWGWGRNGESWLVDHRRLDGDVVQEAVWDDLTELCAETFTCSSGVEMSIARVGIDTGDGMTTDVVYSWCRRMGRGQVIPLKGRGNWTFSDPVNGPSYVDVNERGKKVRSGVALWNVYVTHFKSETYGFLRLPKPTDEDLAEGHDWPRGYVHIGQGVTAEWFQQMTAEKVVIRVNKRTKYTAPEWHKTRDRNEALDCRVYAAAVAWLMGAHRWDEKRWADLEAQVNPTLEDPEVAGDTKRPVRKTQKPRQSSWMGGRKGSWF